MAEKMQAEAIPENGWSFLREDGERGFAGQMWGDVGPHEALRLPMLYLTKHILPFFGDMNIEDITTADVQLFLMR